MTCLIFGKSKPLAARSVATSTSFSPFRNYLTAYERSSYSKINQLLFLNYFK